MRTWTRAEAIENLADYNAIRRNGGLVYLRTVDLGQLTNILRAEGYRNFVLIEREGHW